MPQFIFDISSSVLTEENPLVNDFTSFSDVSRTTTVNGDTTTVTITWTSYTNKNMNDGLSFNTIVVSYGNSSSINIKQFGGIALPNMETINNGSFVGFAGIITATDVPSITNNSLAFCFANATSSNFGNINNWDVSNVTNMDNMFYNASSFNQPLNNWNVSNVTNMDNMFDSASSFNQDILFNFTNVNTALNFTTNTGYNAAKMSRLLKILYNNDSFTSKNIGSIPSYLNHSAIASIVSALTSVPRSNIIIGTAITPDLTTFKSSGYSITDLIYIGYTLNNLSNSGYTKTDFTNALYTPLDLLNGDFTKIDFSNALYTVSDLSAASFTKTNYETALYTPLDLLNGDFTKIDFSNALYTVSDLSAASFTKTNYETALYNPLDLLNGDFTKIDFSNALYTVSDLSAASFTKTNYETALYTPLDLLNGDFTKIDFSNALYTVSDLSAASFTKTNYEAALYNPLDLLNGDFKKTDFSNALYTVSDLSAASFTKTNYETALYNPLDLLNGDFTKIDFSNLLYTPLDLLNGDFKKTDFSNALYTVSDLSAASFTKTNYETALYNPLDLLNGDFKKIDFSNLLYTPLDLLNGDFKKIDFSNALYTVSDLSAASFTKTNYETALYNPLDLLNGDFKKIDFSNLLYTPLDLLNGDFKKIDFSNALYTVSDLSAASFTKTNYETALYNPLDLLNVGFKKIDFSNLLYTPLDLLNGDFTKIDFSNALYTVSDLSAASFTKTNYETALYNPLDLLNGDFKKIDFNNALYTPLDLLNEGILLNDFLDADYTIQDFKSANFTKNNYDGIYCSIYDLLNSNVYTKSELIQLGYSATIINQHHTFVFDISWSAWSSQKPKKYPILNTLQSFQDLSINQMTDLRTHITTVTIQWSSFTDSNSNDGLLLNSYHFPFYNEPSLKIRQFGGIPFTRNSANNTNFWQFYKFGGSILANDSPYFLRNTNLTNCFKDSPCRIFNNIENWNTYQIVNMQNMFANASYLNNIYIGFWNFTNTSKLDNIITNTGYNSLQSTIFIEDLSYNLTLRNHSNLANIPVYLDTSNVRIAIDALNRRNISFEISGNPVVYNVANFKSLGYSTTELKIQGFTISDLVGSGYSISELRIGKYTIPEMQVLNKFTLLEYIDASFSLQELVNSGYNALDLSINNYRAVEYYNLNPRYFNNDLKQVFTLNEIINAGYSLTDVKKLGYSLNDILSVPIFNNNTILDYKKVGYSLTDISNAGFSFDILQNYSPLPQILKDNSFNVIDFKNINYTIYKLFQLKYSLKDLYETGYSVEEIENDISLNYLDIDYQNIDISHSILDYKNVGYSLNDISNGGFSLNSLENVSPLPQILKDNSFNAMEFKTIGYDISYIYYTLKFNGLDLKNAGYTLTEMKNIDISVNDLKIAGFTPYDLSNNGYTLENMKGIYNVTELVNSGFSLDAIKNVGYNSTDFSYYLNENQTKKLIVNDFITFLNYGYSITDLSINPIDNSYNYFLFEQLYKIRNETQLSQNLNVPFTTINEYTTNAFNELFNNWNDGHIIIQYNLYSFLIYNYYYDLGIQLQHLQKMDFTKNEILMLNYYNYNNGLSFITLNTFYDCSFQANKLLIKNMYIDNNEINSLFINTDYTFYSNQSPFLHYIEIDFTNLNHLKYNYNNIYQIFNNHLPVINNNIDILSTAFTFYDSSNNVVTTYNKIIISENGWISLLNNNITLCSIRFFPYDVLPNESNIRNIQYNHDYTVIEINIQIFIDNIINNIIIHLNRDGLFTFYLPFNLDTKDLLYSPPDPTMNINCLYYTLPLYYTLNNDNTVNSFLYNILRFNFDNSYDGKFGYSAKTLLSAGYSLQNLVDASCSAIELRNAGFSASELIGKDYSINEIISAYNPSIVDLSNLGYTISDMKQFYFTKKYYENNNITPTDLSNNNYSIDDLIYIGYRPIDLNGLSFTSLDYLVSKIFDKNYIYFSYLLDNVFTILSLADLYSYFNEGDNFTTYFYLIEKIYNNLDIEKIYDTGYLIGSNTMPGGTSNDFIDFSLRLQKRAITPTITGSTVNLDIDYISIYNLIDINRFTLKNIHDASYTLYDFNYTNLNNRNQIITIEYHDLVDASYSLHEINEYYYNKNLINSNNTTYFVFDIINFIKDTPSITYNELASNVYQFRDISNNRYRNFTQNEKIIIMYNLYGYNDLSNNYGIDFILQNHYPLVDLKYLFQNEDIPLIPLTKLVNNNYPPYDVFYLYYVIYGYNNFNTIYDLFVSSNISNTITLFYFMSFYYTSFLYNFIFYNFISDYYPSIPNSTSYSLNMNEIIDYGHQVKNMIYYDFSITKYHDSLFYYSPLDLYNNGFEMYLLTPYYTLNEFYNSGFTLNIINQFFNITINILIDIGYNVSDFKQYGYSITLLYPNYYSLSALKLGGYIIDDFMTIPNITIHDLKNAGFILYDFARFYTKQQLLLEGYSEKELNSSGTVLEYYCKKEACKKTLVSFQKSNTISSKMAYSQNIKNKNVSYSTNYSTYANNINNTTLFCVNNNNKVPTSSNQCNTFSNATMNNSYFIRNYITTSLSNAKIVISNSTMQQSIMHLMTIQNDFPNISFVQILKNYIYIVLQLGFDYPDPIIENMIINNFTDNVNKIFSKVTDSYMIQYINDILDLYKNNPSFELDFIINTYLSKINTI
jgi:surface protein